MASSSTLPLIAVLIISLFFPSPSFSSSPHGTNSNGGIGFTAHLINRNSIKSPFYNPNLTQSGQIQAAISRSSLRHRYFQSLTSKGVSPNAILSPIKYHGGEYIMRFYIGTPPTETFAIMDTASELIWIQCLPCENCFPQKSPIFDPKKSHSFEKITCGDDRCKLLGTADECHKDDDTCHYGIEYGDHSSTNGDLSIESLIFGDHGPNNRPKNITFINMIFGCGHKNVEVAEGDDNPPGIVGLNRKSLSFLSQLERDRFSYCLVPPENVEAESLFHLGGSAIVDGPSTPIEDVGYQDFYYLGLRGISVDNETLPIPENNFNVTANNDRGFIIDSGTRFTILEVNALMMLVDVLAKKMVLPRVQDPFVKFDLCYKAVLKDLVSGPTVKFHFIGVDLQWGTLSTWVDIGHGIYCLAMKPTSGMSILGNHQQQDLNIGFDLAKKTVSFKGMDCAKNN